jgi:hypothetical protein
MFELFAIVFLIIVVVGFMFSVLLIGDGANPYLTIGVWLAILIVASGVAYYVPDQIEVKTVDLVSLNDGNSLSGSFFLGSGYISNYQVYSYYYKVGDGYARNMIYASRTVIYMDEDTKPYLKSTAVNGNWPYYELHVPRGTIVKDVYNLDNK